MDIATILSKPFAKLLIFFFGRHYVPIWHHVHGKNIKEIIDQYHKDKFFILSKVKYDQFQNATYGSRRHVFTDIVSTFAIKYEMETGKTANRMNMTKETVDFINHRKGKIFKTAVYWLKDFQQENYYSRCFWSEARAQLIEQYHAWLYEETATMHYQDLLTKKQLEIEFTANFNHIKQITWIEPTKKFIYQKQIFHRLDNGDIYVEEYLLRRNKFILQNCQCYDAYYNLIFKTNLPVRNMLSLATRQKLTKYKYDFDAYNNWTSYYTWSLKTKQWILMQARDIQYYPDFVKK